VRIGRLVTRGRQKSVAIDTQKKPGAMAGQIYLEVKGLILRLFGDGQAVFLWLAVFWPEAAGASILPPQNFA
jgi:hypothetical protein